MSWLSLLWILFKVALYLLERRRAGAIDARTREEISNAIIKDLDARIDAAVAARANGVPDDDPHDRDRRPE